MLSAISAELLKFGRHRSTWLLVWIFPIGLLIIFTIGISAELIKGSPPARGAPSLDGWLEDAADFWGAPRNAVTRYFMCAYVAVVFAGEYGWNTWKLIVPHRARSSLIAAKYLTSLGLILISFTLAALLMTALGWLEDVLTGDPVPQGITAGAIVNAHWQGFLGALPTILITVGYASLAAILTRSTVAALVIGIVVITVEQLVHAFGVPLSVYAPGLVELVYQLLPGYHIANLSSWLFGGVAEMTAFPSGEVIEYGWAASLGVLGLWLAVLVGATFWRFRQQDIN